MLTSVIGVFKNRNAKKSQTSRPAIYVMLLTLTISMISALPTVTAQSTGCAGDNPLEFSVDADIAGAYTVWSRVQIKDDGSSMHIGTGNNCVETPLNGSQSEWRWVKANSKLLLGKNIQTVSAYIPNDGETWVDKIIFTLDDSCVPEGSGEGCKLDRLEATLVGIKPGGTINEELKIFAEVKGLSSNGTVTFTIDNNEISSNLMASSGIYCLSQPVNNACDTWDSSELSEGAHSLRVSIEDNGRRVSQSRVFNIDKTINLTNEDAAPDSTDDAQNTSDEEPTTATNSYSKPTSSTENIVITVQPTEDSSNSGNKAIANEKQTSIPVSSAGNEDSTKRAAPVVIVDTSAPIESNLEGEIELTVPTGAITSPDDTITYSIDGEEVATATGDSPTAIVDTSNLDNRRHEIGAEVLDSNGEVTSVEIPVIVNNSPFSTLKRALTSTAARIIIVLILLGTAAAIVATKGRKYLLNRQLSTARIINPQPASYGNSQHLNSGMYAALMVAGLVGFSGVVIASPDLYRSDPVYSGNATIIVEAETSDQSPHSKLTDNGISYVQIAKKVTTTASTDQQNTDTGSNNNDNDNSNGSNDDESSDNNVDDDTQDTTPIVASPAGSNTTENVISDIWGKPGNTQTGTGGVFGPWAKNDAHPDIPGGYDFYDGARASAWNDVDSVPWVQPWCTAYRQESGVGETNWRLQIRNYKYAELKGGAWKTLYSQGDSIWGGAYFNKAVQNSVPGSFQFRSDGGGMQSVAWNDAAAGLHPWAERRIHTEYGTARFATAEMRLVPNTDPNVDLSKVRALGICTWDQYTAVDCYVGKPGCTVHDGLYPRHKYITSEWQHFNAITVPISGATDNPNFTYEEAAQAIRNINPPIN